MQIKGEYCIIFVKYLLMRPINFLGIFLSETTIKRGPGHAGKRMLFLKYLLQINMYASFMKDAYNTKTQIAFLNKYVHSHRQVRRCSGVGGSSSVSLLVTDHIGFIASEIDIITDVPPTGEVYLHSSRGV